MLVALQLAARAGLKHVPGLHKQKHTVHLYCILQSMKEQDRLMAAACSRMTGYLCMLRHTDLAWQPGTTALGWPCCLDAMCQGDCRCAACGTLCRASTDCFSSTQDSHTHTPTHLQRILHCNCLKLADGTLAALLRSFGQLLAKLLLTFPHCRRPRDSKAFQPPCLALLQVAPGSFHPAAPLSAQPRRPLSGLGLEILSSRLWTGKSLQMQSSVTH